MTEGQFTRIEGLLEQAIAWLRVLAAPAVKSWVEPILTTTDERKVYQASVGVPREKVAEVSGVSKQTVSNYWSRWKTANPAIISETTIKGRYQRLYDLDELMIPLEVSP
jgi:hypothetical protein